MKPLGIERLIRFFVYATVFNLAAAVAFVLPVVVPEFTFPLILTVWPGTWALVAYLDFAIVGVLGSLGWAALLSLVNRHFHKEYVNRYLSEAHFILTNLSIYGQTSLMFALGYIGGNAALEGFGRGVITQGLIGWMVVPIGVFTYLYLVGTVLGIANILLTLARPATTQTV